MFYSADFETLATEGIDETYVWAWGVTEINEGYYFECGSDIEGFISHCASIHENNTYYFHNLKFDGNFIISYLLRNGFKHVVDKKQAKNNTFTTLISDMGVFYQIEIYFVKEGKKVNKATILNSLNILPFTVSEIAKGFHLPIMKGEIDYKKFRPKGYKMTDKERNYLQNDCEIVAQALKSLFDASLTKMTQGSNALEDYKRKVGKNNFNKWFPTLPYEVDTDIRRAYKGGWVYCNPKFQNKKVGKGKVFDVNSLYPWVMRYKKLPYGKPVPFKGKYKKDDYYPLFIQQINCSFEIKKNHLPTLQIKGNKTLFCPTEYLTTSEGHTVNLVLTNVDLELMFEHYEVYDIKYIDGWKFKATNDLFNDYIDYWTENKIKAKKEGNYSQYILSKLMMNALYGKFGLNPNVQSKYPVLDNETEIVKYKLGDKEQREGIYIPLACFVTAYARQKTITASQLNYDRFCYADTDSMHLVGDYMPDNIEIHSTKLGAWDNELNFVRAKYIRQKSYIEEYFDEKESKMKFKVTCAGLPKNCLSQVTWENFKKGTSYTGKLVPRIIKGGVVLEETEFTIK